MIVKIYSNGTYHLFDSLKSKDAIPFTEILRHCKGKFSKNYTLYREYEDSVEKVGTIRVRDLLLIDNPIDNPIFHSLQALRGKGYTWADFVEARKKKLKEKNNRKGG